MLDLPYALLPLFNKRRILELTINKGSALALKTWAWQLSHSKEEPLPGVGTFTDGRGYFENEDQMLEQLRVDLAEGIKKAGKTPTVLVMGALVGFIPFHCCFHYTDWIQRRADAVVVP
jgi:hypothetical protein